MKQQQRLYWVITGLMAAFMGLGAIVDVLKLPEAIALIQHLRFPEYFVRFIGVLKILGVAAILGPVPLRLKEWAYAGLVFDTLGAVFAHISSGDGASGFAPALVAFVLVMAFYFLFLRKVVHYA